MAVSEEKIQERSRRRGRFSSSHFPCWSAQTLPGIAFRAAGKSGNHLPAASKFAGKVFPARNFGQPQPPRVLCGRSKIGKAGRGSERKLPKFFGLSSQIYCERCSEFLPECFEDYLCFVSLDHTPPANKILTQKNSGGIIFGAIATILRNQLRKTFLREIFSKELRKFRVTQYGRVCCLSSHQLHKINLGELIS